MLPSACLGREKRSYRAPPDWQKLCAEGGRELRVRGLRGGWEKVGCERMC